MTGPRQHLVASDLRGVLRSVLEALAVAREEIDDLNVFPVPDGDTGTNMHATVLSALQAVEELDTHADDRDIARAAAHGALRGAIGNSGVIFSQVVRAVADHLAEQVLDVTDVETVLGRARALATEAVAEPVEGTILSALDTAASAAGEVSATTNLATLLALVIESVGEAVAASRDVLEQNRAAGVVDAGARGLEVALDGLLAFVEGRRFEAVPPPPVRRTVGEVVSRESGAPTFAFEVQYLLEAPDEVAAALRTRLQSLGDSVVVVSCGGLLNVHVHTNEVDEAVAIGAEHGEPARVTVTAFADEYDSAPVQEDPTRTGPSRATEPERTAVGYLAVVPGHALARLVQGAGAVAVTGAPGDLPTVATVLNAVGTVEADEVVLLPGHPNVVPTMRQAIDVSVAEGGRALHVVTRADSVPAVLAVLAVGATDTLDVATLDATADAVAAGEVVAAVRDAQTPHGPVREGQWLGLVDGEVIAVGDDVVPVVDRVVERLVASDCELLTLVVGAGPDEEERTRVRKLVEDHAPGCEVEVVEGGQRPARWILGAE